MQSQSNTATATCGSDCYTCEIVGQLCNHKLTVCTTEQWQDWPFGCLDRPRLDSPGFFLDHRDRLEQLERQRERDRKLREQQKEQRELKDRERRAEERRKERDARRDGK